MWEPSTFVPTTTGFLSSCFVDIFDFCIKTAWWKIWICRKNSWNGAKSFLGLREEQKVVVWIESKCKSERWKHKESESYHNFLLPLHWREANNMDADDSSTRGVWTDEERTMFRESVHQTDRNVFLDGNSGPTPPCLAVESTLSAALYCCSRRMTCEWK